MVSRVSNVVTNARLGAAREYAYRAMLLKVTKKRRRPSRGPFISPALPSHAAFLINALSALLHVSGRK